ncbi:MULTISPECIES: hypothetical protein [Corynebacterium]|uniref:hypothetical protein n=1 Tax=Corynebacterium TaxID=1716 RepID=UPI00254ABFD1|nr:hypothetical protein [Corynebacterium sp. MSK195]MDK8669528.1 hypothetical protein [Corynebacterium sp. MSK195]
MRIRNAAIAGATALAVAFGGTTVAVAAEGSSDAAQTAPATNEGSSQQGSSSEGQSFPNKVDQDLELEGEKEADGTKIFGSSKDFSEQPVWAKVLYSLTILGGIGAVLGGVIGPVFNFINHGPSF